MTQTSKILGIYRIPVRWCLEIVAYYLLRLFGITYKKGERKLRFYLHLINCDGRLVKNNGHYVTCKYRFSNKDLIINLRTFPSSDPEVFEQIFKFQEYSPVMALIQDKKRKLKMIDAGANIGLTTIYFKCFFDDIEVVAVEPDKENFELLSRNFAANQISVKGCINSALWNVNTNLKTTSSFRDGRSWSVTVEEAGKMESDLQGVTLAALFDQFNLETLDLLKMDIEGAEKYIFQDAEAIGHLLRRTKYFSIEIHDEVCDRGAIERQLRNAGIKISHHGELTIGENERL